MNPKLYPLKKKLYQQQIRQQQLLEGLGKMEKLRTQLSQEYTRMTSILRSDEKVKDQIADLEKKVEAKDQQLQSIKAEHGQIMQEISELERHKQENSEITLLHQKHKKYLAKLAEERTINSNLTTKLSEIEAHINDLRSGRIKCDTAHDIRSEMRRLEQDITSRSDEIAAKELKKQQLAQEAEALKRTLEGLGKTVTPKSILKSPTRARANVTGMTSFSRVSISPQQVSNASPRLSAPSASSPNKSKVSSASGKRKTPVVSEEETKRSQLIHSVEQTVNKGKVANLPEALKTVGKPGQGVASKIIELNRTPVKK